MIVVTNSGIFMAILYFLNYTFRLSVTKYICASRWMFPPLDILLEYWIDILPSDAFMACLHSLLRYSTGEFQALQLIVLAAFGAMD